MFRFNKKLAILILKKIYSYLFSRFIIFSLFYYQTLKKKKIIYSNALGYGDNIIFYLHFYLRIKKSNYYIFNFCDQIDGPLRLLFNKEKILKPFIPIPFFGYYSIIEEVKKSKFFKPFINDNEWNKILDRKNKDSIKNLLNLKLKKHKPSKKMKFFLEKKLRYICFHIKFNLNKNDISGSNARGTSDLKKIFSLINYLIYKNYAVLILGIKTDPSIKLIREYILRANLENKVYFLLDHSDNYNFVDQLLSANYSQGYLGNGAGCAEIFYYLKKKSLIFDHTLIEYLQLNHFKKYRKILFKKCIIDDRQIILEECNLFNSVISINVVENSTDEIKKEINHYLLN